MERLEIALRLIQVTGLKRQQFMQLLPMLAQTARVDQAMLVAAGLTTLQARQFLSVTSALLEPIFSWLLAVDHHLLLISDQDYPPLLSHIGSPPRALFVTGNKTLLTQAQVAIVGSRYYSHYGEKWAAYFAEQLAQQGLVITSGLALGIDSIAHRAALTCQQKTIAVLGSGLQAIYPKQHQALAEQIIAQEGAVISEFMLTTPPQARHFPQRNRLISGLSLAVLVIEASLKSGSLITARYALEQGRHVFAVPGPLAHPQSQGTNWLIQQGADLVTDTENILTLLASELRWLPPLREKALDRASLPLATPIICDDPQQQRVVDHLEWHVVTDIDTLASRTQLPTDQLLSLLSQLEIKGVITYLPGGYIRRDK